MKTKIKTVISKKKREPALIKINRELYEAIRLIVKKNPVEYPSMKHFVEQAAMSLVGSKKYDIEGVKSDRATLNEKLEKVIEDASREATVCVLCNKTFFKQEGSNSKNICSDCRKSILHLSKILGKK